MLKATESCAAALCLAKRRWRHDGAQVSRPKPVTSLLGVMFADGALPELNVNPKSLETGLRTNSAAIPYTIPLRISANGFLTFLASTIGLKPHSPKVQI